MPYTLSLELPFQFASDTSRDAALVAESFAPTQEARVLAWFCGQAEGATQHECASALGVGRASVAARVNALWRRGALIKTAIRRGGCAVYRAEAKVW